MQVGELQQAGSDVRYCPEMHEVDASGQHKMPRQSLQVSWFIGLVSRTCMCIVWEEFSAARPGR